MSKFRAFSTHFIVSTAVVAVFLCVMFFLWYPAPYFEVDGGWTVLRILVGVDLVLGPLLTLILFKSGKPGLKFDMSVIALLQIGALGYGGWVIYQQRPQFLVFTIDRFVTVAAAEVDRDKLKYAELNQLVSKGPLLVQAVLPDDMDERDELMWQVFQTGKDIDRRPEYYQPYSPDVEGFKSRRIGIERIVELDRRAKARVDAFLERHGGSLQDYFYAPLTGKNKEVVLVLSGEDAQPVGIISINPWLQDYQQQAKS